MKLAAVVYSTDHEFYTGMAVQYLRAATRSEDSSIVVIDNGSGVPFQPIGDINVRYEENIGGNAVFHRWLTDDWFEGDPPDILAFLHCDLMIHEAYWDQRVINAFEQDPQLGLVGFVGSNQIDNLGGRGSGTMLNYYGAFFEGIGSGSPAEHHGRTIKDLRPAAVVDHCSMIFRRSVLEQLTPQEGNFAPEHFYDRILSCETIERGHHVAVLGIGCDHFSGGIGPGMASADALRKRWLESEGIAYDPADSYTAVYVESEQRFFRKYRDNGFFPFRVDDEYRVSRP